MIDETEAPALEWLQEWDGFQPPAQAADLSRVSEVTAGLTEEALAIYRLHDGSTDRPTRGAEELPVRLIPIQEALSLQEELRYLADEVPRAGDVFWMWTDDNSNYLGLYTSGPLEGWLTKLDHEEPVLTPAYRSVEGFVRSLRDAMDSGSDDDQPCDLVMVPREVPVLSGGAAFAEGDRRLVNVFKEHRSETTDPEIGRLYAFCAICLTPVDDTSTLLPFLAEDDMWIPEAAATLIDLRGFTRAVPELERLAVEGRPNGDSAAMRCLARMGTSEARAAVKRLSETLTGQKAKVLQMWTGRPLRPPRWE